MLEKGGYICWMDSSFISKIKLAKYLFCPSLAVLLNVTCYKLNLQQIVHITIFYTKYLQ